MTPQPVRDYTWTPSVELRWPHGQGITAGDKWFWHLLNDTIQDESCPDEITVGYLAQRYERTVRTVARSLHRLEAAGVIRVIAVSGKASRYALLYPQPLPDELAGILQDEGKGFFARRVTGR